MYFDQRALFLPAGIACLALAVTIIVVWSSTRGDKFLVTLAIGALFIAAGSLGFLLSGVFAWHDVDAVTYAADASGMAIAYVASNQFRAERAPWIEATLLGVIGLLVILPPFLLGLYGLGTIMFNFVAAILLGLTARQYWLARAEAPAALGSITILYALTGLSFAICGVWLARTNPLMLDAPPDNPAEQVNAMMSLVGITGIGALSLAVSQMRAARHHQHAARTDSLTGLLNRRALFERFGSGPLAAHTAVIIFDLDWFKAINDRYGHAIGDEVLRRFAVALTHSMRPEDHGGRLGGEEFVLIKPAVSLQMAKLSAENVCARFKADMANSEVGELRATASAGVAMAGKSDDTLDAVLSQADHALYEAKAAGRDCVHVAKGSVRHLRHAGFLRGASRG